MNEPTSSRSIEMNKLTEPRGILSDFDEKFTTEKVSNGFPYRGWYGTATPDHIKAYISQKLRQTLEGLKRPDYTENSFDLYGGGYNQRNAELRADIDKIINELTNEPEHKENT